MARRWRASLTEKAGPGGPAQAWRPAPQIEMLTPKGEHPFPCSTRGMFDGRIRFDGIATPPKTFGSWILWLPALQVKQKSAGKFWPVIGGGCDIYRVSTFPQGVCENGKRDGFDPLILV